MKDIITEDYAVVDFPKGSPREVLRKAFEFELISDDGWLDMLRDRNNLTHDYDGTVVKEICRKLLENYLNLLEKFRETVDSKYK